MKKLILCTILGAALFSAHSQADLRWNYIGAGYADAFGDGPYVEASFKLDPSFVLQADYSRLSRGAANYNVMSVGINYLSNFKLDFTPRSQTYLMLGLDNVSGADDSTGVYGGVGLRHPLTPQVELFTQASYHTVGDDYGSFAGGIAFFLSPDWAVRSSMALNSGKVSDEFRLGMSYQF